MKSNLYRKFRTFAFTAGLVCVSVYAMTNAAGPPAENTGAPGETTCGQSACHNFSPITSGPVWSNITMSSNIPASGYVPGNTYSITLTVVAPGHNTCGFQMTIQDGNGVNAGTFTAGTGTVTQTSNGKSYINHNSGGNAASGGRSWTFSWNAPSPGQGTLNVYAAVNTANGDQNNTGDTIYTKGFVLYLTGTAPPTAVAGMDKSTVCAGTDTIRFTGSGLNNPTGYSWFIQGGTFISGTTSTSQNPVVIMSGSGAKSGSLTTSNSNGNSPIASFNINVNAQPTATTVPATAGTICGNDSITITAATGTNYNYLWSPGSSTGSSLVVKNSGTFNVKITNSVTGCYKTSSNVVITKRTLPTVSLATSTDSICLGDTVTFTGTAGLSTYDFFKDTTKVQSAAANIFKGAPANSNLSYTVYGTDANGCRSLASNAKKVNVQIPLAAPTVSCDSVSLTSIRFAWTAVTGADGYEASIDSGKTWITPSSGALGLTHSVTGLSSATRVNIRVRAIQSSGKCAKGNSGTVTCQTVGCVPVTFKLTYDSLVCNPAAGDSAIVVVSNVNTSSYSVKVDQVSSTGTLIAFVYPYGPGNSFKVKLNGTTKVYYRFTILDSLQITCAAGTNTINIVGIVSPSADPTLSFNKTTNVLCDREQAIFTFNKPTGTDKYEVFKNSTSLGVTTATSATYPSSTFVNNDVVKVVAISNTTGCGRGSTPIIVKRKPDPKAGFIITVDTVRTVQFNDTTSGAQSWVWKFGDGSAVSTVQNPTHTYTANGLFQVTLHVITADLCESDTATASVKLNTGLININGLGRIEFYPNPVKTGLVIDLSNARLTEQVTFTITDMQGRLVRTMESTGTINAKHQIDLSDLNKAAYMLMIRSGNIQKSFPIIKE